MAITLNTLAYNQDAFVTANKVRYTGPSNTFQTKDIIDLARTAPKVTATSAGVARASFKSVKTLTLADGSKKDMIVETNFAVPVGAVSTDVDAVRDAHGDFIISTDCQDLVNKHDLTK